jgi:glucose-6-phosphate isomerase
MAVLSETAVTQSSGKRAVWRDLQNHYATMQGLHLPRPFADDPTRGERMTAEAAGVYLDCSKNRVNDDTLKLLVELAEQAGLRTRIDAMFRGERINVTENGAVLHVALRVPKEQSIIVDGKNVVPEVHAVLDKMQCGHRKVRPKAVALGLTIKRPDYQGILSSLSRQNLSLVLDWKS